MQAVSEDRHNRELHRQASSNRYASTDVYKRQVQVSFEITYGLVAFFPQICSGLHFRQVLFVEYFGMNFDYKNVFIVGTIEDADFSSFRQHTCLLYTSCPGRPDRSGDGA